jgi:hypothetical protein
MILNFLITNREPIVVEADTVDECFRLALMEAGPLPLGHWEGTGPATIEYIEGY